MRSTNHPSIVKLSSFSESDEYYFLILERQLCQLCVTFTEPGSVMEGGELFHQMCA